jgi:hypothetical protein
MQQDLVTQRGATNALERGSLFGAWTHVLGDVTQALPERQLTRGELVDAVARETAQSPALVLVEHL